MNDIVVYNNGELELKVSIEEENVWLNRNQLSELFDRDVKTIGKHINNVFREKELERVSSVANFATVQKEGNREVIREIEHYNLDVIISIGYRVKSQKGVKFRQWATSVLKTYIQKGYAINEHKINEQRLSLLENDVSFIKSHIKNNSLELKQGIFFDGKIFDAYVFVADIIKSAKRSIVLIDNYIDESILTILAKNQNVQITIYTQTISKQLTLDIDKYNKQYNNLEVITTKRFHDRFLIVDENELYHIFQTTLRDSVSLHGTSLKDLGKKIFAFSKIELNSEDIIQKII